MYYVLGVTLVCVCCLLCVLVVTNHSRCFLWPQTVVVFGVLAPAWQHTSTHPADVWEAVCTLLTLCAACPAPAAVCSGCKVWCAWAACGSVGCMWHGLVRLCWLVVARLVEGLLSLLRCLQCRMPQLPCCSTLVWCRVISLGYFQSISHVQSAPRPDSSCTLPCRAAGVQTCAQ